MRKPSIFAVLAVAFGLLAAHGAAHADLSKGVQKALRGKILITERALPSGSADDKAAIKALKAQHQSTVKHTVANGIPTWTFHYTAFLKRSSATSELSFDFYTADKEKLFVANKRFTGIDPKLKILSGVLTITEDDNLNVGKTYDIKLTGKVKRREVVFATTRVTMK